MRADDFELFVPLMQPATDVVVLMLMERGDTSLLARLIT